MPTERLILASASARRRELLARVGIEFDVIAAAIDEAHRPGERAAAYVRRVAAAKADAVAELHAGRPVLAADTIVVSAGDILGKPADRDEAVAMLGRLVGATHQVTTSFALLAGGAREVHTVTTEVSMRSASDDEIKSYVASGEWRGKAGGYAIQGIAAALILRVEGSVTNVIGLPLAEVIECLERLGAARAAFASGDPA